LLLIKIKVKNSQAEVGCWRVESYRLEEERKWHWRHLSLGSCRLDTPLDEADTIPVRENKFYASSKLKCFLQLFL